MQTKRFLVTAFIGLTMAWTSVAHAATVSASFVWGEFGPDREAYERALAGMIRMIRLPSGEYRITLFDTIDVSILRFDESGQIVRDKDGNPIIDIYEIPRPPLGYEGPTSYDPLDPIAKILEREPEKDDVDVRVKIGEEEVEVFSISSAMNRILFNFEDVPGLGPFTIDTAYDTEFTEWSLTIVPLPQTAVLFLTALGLMGAAARKRRPCRA